MNYIQTCSLCISAAVDLQPSLAYFNREINQFNRYYKSHSSMYAELMPRKYPMGDYLVYSTSQEELALNYKLFKDKSLKKVKGRKRKFPEKSPDPNSSNSSCGTTSCESTMARNDDDCVSVEYLSGDTEAVQDRCDQEPGNLQTKKLDGGDQIESHISLIGKLVKAKRNDANIRFAKRKFQIQNEIKEIKHQLQVKTQALSDLESLHVCYLEEIKSTVLEKIEKACE